MVLVGLQMLNETPLGRGSTELWVIRWLHIAGGRLVVIPDHQAHDLTLLIEAVLAGLLIPCGTSVAVAAKRLVSTIPILFIDVFNPHLPPGTEGTERTDWSATLCYKPLRKSLTYVNGSPFSAHANYVVGPALRPKIKTTYFVY
jgi:hypothetical protein